MSEQKQQSGNKGTTVKGKEADDGLIYKTET